MRGLSVLLFLSALALGGCGGDMRPEISRFDGKTVEPVAREQATAECTAKAQVAKAGVPYAYGGGSIAEIGRMGEQESVQRSAFQGCMAEKGLKVTWVQMEAATGSIEPKAPDSKRKN